MKNLSHWILALLALAACAGLSGAWTHVQQPTPKQEPPKPERKGQGQGQGQGQGRRPQNFGRGEKQAAIKAALQTMKMTLSEGIALAEKETSGKAFSAGIEINKGKASIVVNVYTKDSDKPVSASIDPETKKVEVKARGEKEEGEGAGGEGGGGGEGGSGGGNGGGGGGGG